MPAIPQCPFGETGCAETLLDALDDTLDDTLDVDDDADIVTDNDVVEVEVVVVETVLVEASVENGVDDPMANEVL